MFLLDAVFVSPLRGALGPGIIGFPYLEPAGIIN